MGDLIVSSDHTATHAFPKKGGAGGVPVCFTVTNDWVQGNGMKLLWESSDGTLVFYPEGGWSLEQAPQEYGQSSKAWHSRSFWTTALVI